MQQDEETIDYESKDGLLFVKERVWVPQVNHLRKQINLTSMILV